MQSSSAVFTQKSSQCKLTVLTNPGVGVLLFCVLSTQRASCVHVYSCVCARVRACVCVFYLCVYRVWERGLSEGCVVWMAPCCCTSPVPTHALSSTQACVCMYVCVCVCVCFNATQLTAMLAPPTHPRLSRHTHTNSNTHNTTHTNSKHTHTRNCNKYSNTQHTYLRTQFPAHTQHTYKPTHTTTPLHTHTYTHKHTHTHHRHRQTCTHT